VMEVEILLNHGVGVESHKCSAGCRLGEWKAVHQPRPEYLSVRSRRTLDPLVAVREDSEEALKLSIYTRYS